MKRLIIIMLLGLFSLTGCKQKTLDDIIANEPSITGIVIALNNNSAYIYSNDQQGTSDYVVNLDVQNSDSYTNLKLGDEIVVYHDGKIAESFPAQIYDVYAITLKSGNNQLLTFNELKELVNKGHDLRLKDFEKFVKFEIGSGLLIYEYPIDTNYSLIIGTHDFDLEPEYIYLTKRNDKNDFIDIRFENIDDYLDHHK